jgi:hypothetical protein
MSHENTTLKCNFIIIGDFIAKHMSIEIDIRTKVYHDKYMSKTRRIT